LTNSGWLTVSLLSPDHSDVPPLFTNYIGGIRPIVGVWQVSCSGFNCETAHLAFRYDPVRMFNVRKEGVSKSLVLLRYDSNSNMWVDVTEKNGINKSKSIIIERCANN
jgi:hypothetical protein